MVGKACSVTILSAEHVLGCGTSDRAKRLSLRNSGFGPTKGIHSFVQTNKMRKNLSSLVVIADIHITRVEQTGETSYIRSNM